MTGARDRVGEAPVAVGLLEHVVADEAPALGDADHLGDVVEPRAGMRVADARDRGAHRVAALELGRGEVVGIGRVDPPVERPHGTSTRPGAVVRKPTPSTASSRCRGRPSGTTGAAGSWSTRTARPAATMHVAVAGRVDDDARLHDLAPALRFEHDRVDAAVGRVRVRAPRVQPQAHAGLAQQVDRDVAEASGSNATE